MTPHDNKVIQEKEARRQHERIFVLGIAAISYILDTFWLGLFYMQGVINSQIPLAYGISSGIICTLFLIAFTFDWNLRLRDKNLTIAQVTAGYIIQLIFLYLVPQLSFLFLLTILLVSAFGMLTMSVRQFIGGWLVMTAITGIIICGVNDGVNINLASGHQSIVFWLAFISILGRIIFVGMRISLLRNKLSQRNSELKISLAQIEQLANVDGLTQVLNRRAFMKIAEEETLRTIRTKGHFCLALIDIDHFKEINDRFGHIVGDEILKAFTVVVTQTIRVTDKLGRYGGEEFILLLPDTGLEGGRKLAERVLYNIHGNDWQQFAGGAHITASMGIVSFNRGESLENLIERSDKALYEAKHSGRNCVIFN